MTAPTPGPAPTAPGVAPDGQQPAPVATPPAGPAPAGPTTPAPTAPGGTQPEGATLGLTQADLDALMKDRLDRQAASLTAQFTAQQQEFQAKLSAAFGLAPEQQQDPAAALAAAQQQAAAYQDQARAAMVESLALAAGIKAERVGVFARLVDLTGALNGVSPTDTAAVRQAISGAVTTTAEQYPEWKTAPGLPASSGGDRTGVGAPSLDEQIAAAQRAGDHRTAIALKRAKALQTPQ